MGRLGRVLGRLGGVFGPLGSVWAPPRSVSERLEGDLEAKGAWRYEAKRPRSKGPRWPGHGPGGEGAIDHGAGNTVFGPFQAPNAAKMQEGCSKTNFSTKRFPWTPLIIAPQQE